MNAKRYVLPTLVATGMIVVLAGRADAGDPCCAIKNVNTATRIVTVVEKSTGTLYEFTAKDARDLSGLRVGQAIDLDLRGLKVAGSPRAQRKGLSNPAGGTMSTPTNTKGSNVDRNADTKNPPCMVKTEDKGWVPCSNPTPTPTPTPPKK